MQPSPQQNVIQRHVSFPPPQQSRQVVPTEPRDFYAKAFIKPERFPREKQKAQNSRARSEEANGEHRNPRPGRLRECGLRRAACVVAHYRVWLLHAVRWS